MENSSGVSSTQRVFTIKQFCQFFRGRSVGYAERDVPPGEIRRTRSLSAGVPLCEAVPFRVRVRANPFLTFLITVSVTGVRRLGALQTLELLAYDWMVTLHQQEQN
jgi:hypothetical protein